MSWRDYATVYVEIATISAFGTNAAFWQPDAHDSRWQPPEGTGPTWAENYADDPHRDWETLPWWKIECDQVSIETQSGLTPYEWNAQPGNLSVAFYDPKSIYTPAGPVGLLDDIGLDTPIRITVHFKPPFPNPEVFTVLWAGLIRSIVHTLEPSGSRMSTVLASEVNEVYGRTNPPALPQQRPHESYWPRVMALHDRSDMPLLFPYPDTEPIIEQSDGDVHAADDLHDNVWQEICAAANMHAAVTFPAQYSDDPRAGSDLIQGTPRVRTRVPAIPVEPLAETDDDRTKVSDRVQVRPYCSPEMVTQWENNPRQRIAISPSQLNLTHILHGIANDVSVAAADVAGSEVKKFDQTSIDRWGRFSYTRHDLKVYPVQAAFMLDRTASRILGRLKQATYELASLTFPVTCPRDLLALVGRQVYNGGYRDGFMPQPWHWFSLVWDDPPLTGRLCICGVSHSITPTDWKVSLTCELWNLNATGPITAPPHK